MPAKRKYSNKGTNDFLVLSLIGFFMCIWAVKDAWYPSESVLKKHPREVAAAFETAGSVDKILVAVGDSVSEKQILATLRRDRMSVEYADAKTAYSVAKKKHTMMALASKNALENGASDLGLSDIENGLSVSEEEMAESLSKVNTLRVAMDASDLRSSGKGQVKEIRVSTHSMVDAGETVIMINPKDHFYLFNKSLAILSFFAFWVFLAIHILAR